MVGNAAPPPSDEPIRPSTWGEFIGAIAALIGLVFAAGIAALGFLIYMVNDGSFFS